MWITTLHLYVILIGSTSHVDNNMWITTLHLYVDNNTTLVDVDNNTTHVDNNTTLIRDINRVYIDIIKSIVLFLIMGGALFV